MTAELHTIGNCKKWPKEHLRPNAMPPQAPHFDPEKDAFYGGLANVTIGEGSFDLGQGILVSPTYGHIFATMMMAFAPASRGKPSPAPWARVQWGHGFDVRVQLCIPKEFSQVDWFDRLNTAWWLTALIRMRLGPEVILPAIADRPFAQIPAASSEATIIGIEVAPPRLLSPSEASRVLGAGDLAWLKANWVRGGRLMASSAEFAAAFQAFDFCPRAGAASLALIAIWGALEELFSATKQELRYRVSEAIAAFLEEPGAGRLALHKQVQKLYDSRSKAAHGSGGVNDAALRTSHQLLLRCLVKMIEDGHVPSKQDLENRVFGVTQ